MEGLIMLRDWHRSFFKEQKNIEEGWVLILANPFHEIWITVMKDPETWDGNIR